MRIPVARVEDFPPGERRIVEAGRRSIGVFRVGDRFYALNNHCPHQSGPLCLGRVAPAPTSSGPGDYSLDGDVFLACPWHGWEYDLATGQSYFGPGVAPVRSYEVSIERIPGPYVAETFAVDVEGDYVVVDTSRRDPLAKRSRGTQRDR